MVTIEIVFKSGNSCTITLSDSGFSESVINKAMGEGQAVNIKDARDNSHIVRCSDIDVISIIKQHK